MRHDESACEKSDHSKKRGDLKVRQAANCMPRGATAGVARAQPHKESG